MNEPIYIIDGARTPFLKSRNRPGPFAASDLATAAGRALLVRQPFAPTDLDEVILGCAAPSPDEVNIGRVVALRMGCGQKVPGWTVMRNCASGMQAIDSAIDNIRAGRSNLVLAGGVDALSRAPLLFSDAMVLWLSNWYAAKTLGAARRARREVPAGLPRAGDRHHEGADRSDGRPADGPDRREPRVPLRHHAARRWTSSPRAATQRVLAAQKAGHFDGEIVPLYDKRGKLYAADDGVREDSTAENLAKLKPVLRPQVRQRHRRQQLADHRRRRLAGARVGARGRAARADAARAASSIREWAGLDPAQMGLGPVHAATPILKRHGLGLDDLDAWEINEAFAAQVIACERAWESADYCRDELGSTRALGALDAASSTSTAARSRSATRSARRARASCCTC